MKPCSIRYLAPILFAGALLCATRDAHAGWLGDAAGGAWSQVGLASYYGARSSGRITASGEIFESSELTAAHPWLPFGTRVRVLVEDTGREVVVTINDRLPSARRVIDLSVGAARELGIVHQGLARVVLTPE